MVNCRRWCFLLSLALVSWACKDVIPTAPQFSVQNVSQYFWSGSPYNPTYLVTGANSGTAVPDQISLRSGGDSLLLTDGVALGGVAHFTVSSSTVTLDLIQPNSILAFPGSTTLATATGVTYFGLRLKIRALLYSNDGTRLIAGTDGNGVWYSDNDGGAWTQAVGPTDASICALAQIPDGNQTIFALAKDSIFYSTDKGNAFVGMPDPMGPHTAITTLGDTAILGGALSYTQKVMEIPPGIPPVPKVFIPPFQEGLNDSILCIVSSAYNTILAGVSQTGPVEADLVFRCHPTDGAWQPISALGGAKGAVYSLVNSPYGVFGGTSSTGVIQSTDLGQTWRLRPNLVVRSAVTSSILWVQSLSLGYAGTTTGEILQFDRYDSNVVKLYCTIGQPVSAMVWSPRGFLLVATNDSLFKVISGTAQVVNDSVLVPILRHGVLTLLSSGANGLEAGATWQAGYVIDSTQVAPEMLTARVENHLDSLELPLPIRKNAVPDVFVIRYASETSAQTPVVGVPFWMIYYARGQGPVLIQLLEQNGSSQATVVNQAVLDPPH